MENYSFVSEKVVMGKTYQAWRSDKSPSEVVVLKDGISINYSGSYDLSGASITGTVTLENTSGGNVSVKLSPGVTYVNSGPNITVDDTLSVNIVITNLVAGSVVYVYDSTTPTTILNAIEPTATSTTNLAYNADKSLIIKVRKKGYKTWETTGTLTSSGYFVPATGRTPLDCYDTTGGPIFMGYPHVVGFSYSGGSGLSTEEHNKLMTLDTSSALTKKQFIALK